QSVIGPARNLARSAVRADTRDTRNGDPPRRPLPGGMLSPGSRERRLRGRAMTIRTRRRASVAALVLGVAAVAAATGLAAAPSSAAPKPRPVRLAAGSTG